MVGACYCRQFRCDSRLGSVTERNIQSTCASRSAERTSEMLIADKSLHGDPARSSASIRDIRGFGTANIEGPTAVEVCGFFDFPRAISLSGYFSAADAEQAASARSAFMRPAEQDLEAKLLDHSYVDF